MKRFRGGGGGASRVAPIGRTHRALTARTPAKSARQTICSIRRIRRTDGRTARRTGALDKLRPAQALFDLHGFQDRLADAGGGRRGQRAKNGFGRGARRL